MPIWKGDSFDLRGLEGKGSLVYRTVPARKVSSE
jgi:hypothetical protein